MLMLAEGGGVFAGVLVRIKVAGDRFAADAVTEYVPVIVLAIKTGAVAIPRPFVTAVAELAPPTNVALAPLEGVVKVTAMPLTGEADASSTCACKAPANAVPSIANCEAPPTAVMDWGTGNKLDGGVVTASALLAVE
jgi:hypothetical protein